MTTVIWIDWYAYHVSRFRALIENQSLKGEVTGIELIGGCGVHTGMKFRDDDRDGLPITSLFPTADWQSIGKLRLARGVWRKLQELKPSTVLVPGYYTLPGIAAALWAKLHRKRSVLMTETTGHDHARVWWKEFFKRVVMRILFDYSITGGKAHVRYLRQLGFPQSRIAHCYDVVDNQFYEKETERVRCIPALRATLQLPPNYFLYVGRLAPEKNIDGLLKAYALYVRSGGTWDLVLVGDGPERENLVASSATKGVGNKVHFAGFKKTNESIHYYAFASCFILPSSREPWGLVANEAMASGLPILISNRCGCAEDLVIAGENGFTFNPADGQELSTRMISIGRLDASALAAMGRRSREIITGYSPALWAAEVARIAQPS